MGHSYFSIDFPLKGVVSRMREADHRATAEELEQTIQQLQSIGGSPRVIIETAWGAGYHWTAYGCQRKYGKHSDKHQGLVKYLEGLNETWAADIWRDFEVVRTGGWYGTSIHKITCNKPLHC